MRVQYHRVLQTVETWRRRALALVLDKPVCPVSLCSPGLVFLSAGFRGGGPGSAHGQQVQQSGGAHSGERGTQIVGFLLLLLRHLFVSFNYPAFFPFLTHSPSPPLLTFVLPQCSLIPPLPPLWPPLHTFIHFTSPFHFFPPPFIPLLLL